MNKSEKVILVAGATGKQGGSVARHLLERGWKVRALTRDAEKPSAKALAKMGMEVFEGDLRDRTSLDRALEGAYGVFSVTTFFEDGMEAETTQGVTLADAAKEAGVEHYVYSSVGGADKGTGIPHFESKWLVEEHIRNIGLDSTVVRPVFFMDNFKLGHMYDDIVNGTLSFGLRPDRTLQMIAVDDIGRCVAEVFERPEKYTGKALDLASDELTIPQAAKTLGDAMGCTVDFREIPVEAILQRNEDYGLMLEWFDREGYDVDLEMMRVFNPWIHKFEDWVRETGWANEDCTTPLSGKVDEL